MARLYLNWNVYRWIYMSELEAKVVWKGTTKPVEFTYRNFDGEKSRRRVDVNQVLYDSNADEVYLKGFCHLRNSERSFKVSNIETMLKCGSKRFYWEEWLRWELDIPTESFQQPISSVSNNSGSGININLRTGEMRLKNQLLLASVLINGLCNFPWLFVLPLSVRRLAFFGWFQVLPVFAKKVSQLKTLVQARSNLSKRQQPRR